MALRTGNGGENKPEGAHQESPRNGVSFPLAWPFQFQVDYEAVSGLGFLLYKRGGIAVLSTNSAGLTVAVRRRRAFTLIELLLAGLARQEDAVVAHAGLLQLLGDEGVVRRGRRRCADELTDKGTGCCIDGALADLLVECPGLSNDTNHMVLATGFERM